MTDQEFDDILREELPKSLLTSTQFNTALISTKPFAIRYISVHANLSLKEAATYYDLYIDCDNMNLRDIIKASTLINLKKREPLPEEAWIVGMSNNKYECDHFYNLRYTNHRPYNNTYGGETYINKDGEYKGWWLMNANYAKFRNEYMFVVPNEESGRRLAFLLNLIGNDWLDFESAIASREEQIKILQGEIETIKKVSFPLREKVGEYNTV